MPSNPRPGEKGNPFDRLQEILETMNVPETRKTDLKWLARNIQVQNGQHPQFGEAKDLIRKLLFIKD
jgi:hypothetical protein